MELRRKSQFHVIGCNLLIRSWKAEGRDPKEEMTKSSIRQIQKPILLIVEQSCNHRVFIE